MQRDSPLLQHASYQFLAGAPPQEKRLRTVGIASMQHPRGSYLLDTLQSTFQASSERELEYIVVLVHLSGPDPAWLVQTAANISALFTAQIGAGKLLVIHGGSPLPGDLSDVNHSSPCEALYSRQKVDHALLMNFASNLSDYFTLLEDHIHCTPKFAAAISPALSAWKELPWVILEFSHLSISGKVFCTSDLSHLTAFLFLFHKDTRTHLLLSECCLLLAQNVPIHFSPSVFNHTGDYSMFHEYAFLWRRTGSLVNQITLLLLSSLTWCQGWL
uniref:MGAT4 conserved region domain-containing protein n=1 Tax=Macaca mulatta TaxID=9544 RepID=A0A5F8AVV4_MACMU